MSLAQVILLGLVIGATAGVVGGLTIYALSWLYFRKIEAEQRQQIEEVRRDRQEFYEGVENRLDRAIHDKVIPAVKDAVHQARFGIPGGRSPSSK